jgi:hypothetical protein
VRAAVVWSELGPALELPAGSVVTYCDPGEWEVGDTGEERRVRVVATLPGDQLACIEVVARVWPKELAPGEVQALAGCGWRHG